MPKTLLVADDSVTIQRVVGITFANEDVEIIAVDNGEDAIQKAKEIKPDIILADVFMPQKDGYEVCQAIKQDPDFKSTPVLLLAGTFEAFDKNRSEKVGADGYINKPFASQALIDKVNELLGIAPAPKAEVRPVITPTPSVTRPKPVPTPSWMSSHISQTRRKAPELSRLQPRAEPAAPPRAVTPQPQTETAAPPRAVTPQPRAEPAAPPRAVTPQPRAEPAAPPRAVTPQPSIATRERKPIVLGVQKPVEVKQQRELASVLAHRGRVVGRETLAKTIRTKPIAEAMPIEPKKETKPDISEIVSLSRDEIKTIASNTIEQIAWEIVPQLAETILREEIEKLVHEKLSE